MASKKEKCFQEAWDKYKSSFDEKTEFFVFKRFNDVVIGSGFHRLDCSFY